MTEEYRDEDLVLVEVHKVWGPAEMEVIKTMLQSHGIPAMTRGQVPQSILPMTTDGMGEIKILVQKKDAALAKKLIGDALKK
ncbi:MAG: DUF2007 domain-containing protein, partial [Candidatus Aminicenantes bacterium]|nr:DUF2007 domain-containing protein [Candidatus Aminicenantes bacterium]